MLYQVTATLNPGVGINDVQNALQLAPGYRSYYRLTNNTWIVSFSQGSGTSIYNALQHLSVPSGRLFICSLSNLQPLGWMDQEFWAWMNTQGYG